MTSTTPGVTDVEVKDGVLYSLTLASPVVVGYTACGLSWFRHEVSAGVNMPLGYGCDTTPTRPWYPDGCPDGTSPHYEGRACVTASSICRDVAAMIGADLGNEARHFGYQSLILRDDGSEQERTSFEWAGRPDHDWESALAIDGARMIDTTLRFDRDGNVVGRMLELETGQVVTLCSKQPQEVVEESFNIWSQLCLTK